MVTAVATGRIKGTIMAEIVKFLRTRKAEARARLSTDLFHYLESTRVLSTDWLPEEDYLALMRVVIDLLPNPRNRQGLALWEAAARRTNPAYFEGGPYHALVVKGDPQRSLTKLHLLWQLRHDTGKVIATPDGDLGATIELYDYALVAAEACALTQGTFWGVLQFSGAEDIELTHTRCRSRSDDVCEWSARWARVS